MGLLARIVSEALTTPAAVGDGDRCRDELVFPLPVKYSHARRVDATALVVDRVSLVGPSGSFWMAGISATEPGGV